MIRERANVTDEEIADLRALVHGMGMMDYRSALIHARDLDEAADWLRHKRLSYI